MAVWKQYASGNIVKEKFKMEKPLSVSREEFVDGLVNLVNNSNLPMFVVLDVLKGAVEEVKDAAARQYEQDRLAYEKSKEESNVSESKP